MAKSTRELAEGLEARGIDETELLYQAEASMLAAADSLAAGKFDTAALQMRKLSSLILAASLTRLESDTSMDDFQATALPSIFANSDKWGWIDGLQAKRDGA